MMHLHGFADAELLVDIWGCAWFLPLVLCRLLSCRHWAWVAAVRTESQTRKQRVAFTPLAGTSSNRRKGYGDGRWPALCRAVEPCMSP